MAKLSDREKAIREVKRKAKAKAEQDAYIKRLVDQAPPLTPEQRDRIAVLLTPQPVIDQLVPRKRKR